MTVKVFNYTPKTLKVGGNFEVVYSNHSTKHMAIHVKKRNGRLETLDANKINTVVSRTAEGLHNVSSSEVVIDAKLQLYDKIPTTEIDKALMFTARSKIAKEPEYSYLAARFILNSLYKEVFGEGVDGDTFDLSYRKSFIKNIKMLVKVGRLNKALLTFNLKKLSAILDLSRDDLFKYHGMQIVYDRYLLVHDGARVETPQAFWMRVAMGLALNEDNPTERAIEFYNLLSSFNGCSSTPTLFNSGTTHSQLSSCFLNTFDDSVDGIFEGLWQEARKSKYAGGLGFDVTPFRATGSFINGTNGTSSGLIPWLKLFNDMLVAVNQGGKRTGSGCAYLEVWHLDVEEFIQLRKVTGEERRRTHDLNTALWLCDEFMRCVDADKDWYLFCPTEVPTLHETFGVEFDREYAEACAKADAGVIKKFKKISAKALWKSILASIYETSHPWLTFKDPCNLRYSNQHAGVVHSSNLCTEIMLHTEASSYKDGIKTKTGETAVCNLGSVNVPSHIENGKLNLVKLKQTITTMIRMLDNVIDINFYPTEEAANSNLKHRPIGLGLMGYQDACHLQGIKIDSEESAAFASKLQEFISFCAIEASSDLAATKGKYSTFEGSLWSKGILPVDSFVSSQLVRFNEVVDIPYAEFDGVKLPWDDLRKKVQENGMRNSNVMAIAPTATISYIQGIEQSIEPNASMLFVYKNQSGDLPIINEHFVKAAKEQGIWCPEFAEAIVACDGDVTQLNISAALKEQFKPALQRDIFMLIAVAASRQVWIDQGQSFNFYNNRVSMSYMSELAKRAWRKGLKTTYYWRNEAATKVEKTSAASIGIYGAKEEIKACSLEARARGEICESCQ